MSQEPTEQTKLGPGFDAVGVSTAVDQDYPNDWEMEDTASNSVSRWRGRSRNGRVLVRIESTGRTYCGLTKKCDGYWYSSSAESR